MYVIIDDVEGRQLTPVQSLRLRNAALMYAVLWWNCKTRLPIDARSMQRYSEALASCEHDEIFQRLFDRLSGYQAIIRKGLFISIEWFGTELRLIVDRKGMALRPNAFESTQAIAWWDEEGNRLW